MNAATSQPISPKGKAVEVVVGNICGKMFLPDLTVTNPKLRKGGKLDKEIADVLIPLRDCVLCFQIKSKTELRPLSEKTSTDIDRIIRRVEEGIDQLKELKSCLKQRLIDELRNSRGIVIPFDCAAVKKVYGIVVLELLGEEKFPEHERTAISTGFIVRDGMPVHIFKLEVFETISTEIDTVPDFLDYLEIRELLIAGDKLAPLTDELDFLAFYKTRQDLVQKLRTGEITLLMIEPDWWRQHLTANREMIAERNQANAPSYFWDEVIKTLHSAVGFAPDFRPPSIRNDAEQGSSSNYYAALLELSTMRRIERRMAGQKLLEVIQRAVRNGHGYSFVGSADGAGANVVVFASNQPRAARAESLLKVCSLFYCGLGLKKLVGIATEPATESQRSYDVICLEGEVFENAEEIREMYRREFKEVKRATVKEYGRFEQT